MRIFLGLYFLALAFAEPAQGEGADSAAVFQKANGAYRGGDYSEAAALYESLIREGGGNAAVHYNLGNAYFKQKRLGPAILHYEKARRASPRDRDILANLHYVRDLLEYRIEDKRNWYLRALEAVLSAFRPEEMGIASLLLGVGFWASWILPLYLRPEAPWGWRRKILLLFTMFFACLWILKATHGVTVQEAIVLKDQAAVRYGPSHKDQVAFKLAEGMKLRVKKKAGEWGRVALVNGETGWMSLEEVGVI